MSTCSTPRAPASFRSIMDEIQRKMVGQAITVRHTLAAFLASGHVLLEDVPGTGKTTLAASLATVVGLQFRRVQGTPDLLPSELVGTMVYNPATTQFTFRPGPIFTHVLVMDEINRATPRTQSALLEAMAESQVSVDGHTHALDGPFFVIATANPIESQGVFPLPEAQLDRFMVRLKLGYTSEEDEIEMVRRVQLHEQPILNRVVSSEQLLAIRQGLHTVRVQHDVLQYITRLARASREHEQVLLGASPRSIVSLTSFSQALALLSDREYVTPDDVQEAWIPVMNHRIHARLEWDTGDEVLKLLQEILASVTAPSEFCEESS